MLKKYLFTLFLGLATSFSFGQKNEYILFLDEKPMVSQAEIENQFSPKALKQRAKIGFDFYDLPVSKLYISKLNEKGSTINKSKWLNAVHYSSAISEENILTEFPFISHFILLHPSEIDRNFTTSMESESSLSDTSLYSNSYEQLEMTSTISCMHNKGFDGSGVLIAVLDAGFPEMDSMRAFADMRNQGRIIDSWDFEDNSNFVYHKSTHGTYVSSIVGAKLDSAFIGSAPEADYAFYLTEITRFERNIEEFNLVLGLERADSIGADICSISLGYRNFDTLQTSYGYAGMDGRTTIVAQGVTVARNKGMIISTAAGNNGRGAGTLASPCDADSILCVGAINYDSTRAHFTSEGPTFDGRTKPDVVTIGRRCFYVHLDDSIRSGNGTSFATPLFSGLVACLKQAHPLRTNFQLIDAIKSNSDRALNPHNTYGWGIPNACKIDSALTLLDSVILSTPERIKELKVSIYPNPSSSIVTINSVELITDISIISLDGKLVSNSLVNSARSSYQIDISALQNGTYFVIITSLDRRKITKKLVVN
ncbi:MAG: S8/S53 family peptidase [Flavobacteriales bacterium]